MRYYLNGRVIKNLNPKQGFRVDIDLGAWQMETWFEEYLEQSIKQTEQEMIDKIEDKLNKISYTEELLGGMYDPGGMGAEVVNLDEVIEYLESLKHDK